uniref:RdRp catalytic domain-containing protein n=1 Tax=Arundo donax TaxID=35708 RepID=A0A0A8ZZ67_ARUDO
MGTADGEPTSFLARTLWTTVTSLLCCCSGRRHAVGHCGRRIWFAAPSVAAVTGSRPPLQCAVGVPRVIGCCAGLQIATLRRRRRRHCGRRWSAMAVTGDDVTLAADDLEQVTLAVVLPEVRPMALSRSCAC